MALNLNKDRKAFIGEWEKELLEDGKKQLTRHVKIGDKEYSVSARYSDKLANYLDNPELPVDETVKKIMDASEKQIAQLIESFQEESAQIEKITVKTNVEKRTGSVAVKTFGKNEELFSLAELKVLNLSMTNAVDSVIKKIASCAMANPRIPQTSEISSPLAPFKEKAGQQLEEILNLISEKEPEPDEYGVKRYERVDFEKHPVEVKEFTEGAYNGALMEDYRRRQLLVMKAATTFVAENFDQFTNDNVSKSLKKLNESFEEEYKKPGYRLEHDVMKSGKGAAAHLEEINKKQVNLIAQFIRDASHIISSEMKSGECKISDLDRLERELVLNRGRPIIVNIFKVHGQKFFSMQTPETRDGTGKRGNTIPSTLREREGLANYVSTTSGTISEKGDVTVEHHAIRHASYTPIAIEDSYLRQGIALQNVKQLMRDLAVTLKSEQGGGDSRENPIVIPLRSMMLLTPLVGDHFLNKSNFVTGEWRGESEFLQMRESAQALSVMRGRAVQLRINGEDVWVKLDSSYMNLGANKEAARIGPAGLLPIAALETEINHRGYLQFIDDVNSYLFKQELPVSVKNLLEELRKLEIQGDRYEKSKDELEKLISSKEEDLNLKNAELEEFYKEYRKKQGTEKKNEIETLRDEVRGMESTINKKYGQLYERRIKAVRGNEGNILLLKAQILGEMEEEIKVAKDDQKKKDLVLVRDILNNYFQAKELFESQAYRKAETVMDFQTLYIQTYEMMNYLVEFFCKSAEDRTGRVDNKVQERVIYSALHDQQANRTEEDRRKIDLVIAPSVHKYSASYDNTLWNSESPGLQITRRVNPSLQVKTGKRQARMAKLPYQEALKKKRAK